MDALQSGVPRDVNLGAVQNDDGRPDRSAFDFLELPGGFSDVALDESYAVYAGRVARGALRLAQPAVEQQINVRAALGGVLLALGFGAVSI